jgi:hypothetical protein
VPITSVEAIKEDLSILLVADGSTGFLGFDEVFFCLGCIPQHSVCPGNALEGKGYVEILHMLAVVLGQLLAAGRMPKSFRPVSQYGRHSRNQPLAPLLVYLRTSEQPMVERSVGRTQHLFILGWSTISLFQLYYKGQA